MSKSGTNGKISAQILKMSKTLVWLLVFVVFFLDSAAGQSDTDRQEFNSSLKDLIVANDLKEE